MLGRLRKLIVRNGGLKVLSLLLATLLWYLAAGQEKMESSFIVPVEFTNVPDTVALEGNSLEFIHVRMRGSRSAIQELSPEQIRASVDLRNIRPGDHILTIDNRNIHIPKGVELVSVSPQYLSAKISARRLVPIRVALRGRPADGFEVVRYGAIPSKIYIIGPSQKVNVIREVSTFPVSIRGATGSLNARAEMASPDPEVRLLELKPTEVSIVIQGHAEERMFRNVTVRIAGAQGATFTPSKVSVTLKGPFNLLEKMSDDGIDATVEIPQPRERSFSGRVLVSAPEGLNVTAVSPSAVKVALP